MRKKIIIWSISNLVLLILNIILYYIIADLYLYAYFGTYLKCGEYVINKPVYRVYEDKKTDKYKELKFNKIIFLITEVNKDTYEKRTQDNILKHKNFFKKEYYYQFSAYIINEDNSNIPIDIIKTRNVEAKRNAPIHLNVKINNNEYKLFFIVYKIYFPFSTQSSIYVDQY